jgi:DNA-binding transcriptional MerR regulator
MPSVASDARLRVEELARRIGLSVDTIRFYQKRRLLDPPERRGRIALYGAAHLARLKRIKELQAKGLTLAVIRRVLEGELDEADLPLAALVARAQVDQGETTLTLLTRAELSDRSGVPIELIDAVVGEGLLVPRWVDGVEFFTDVDVGVLEAGLALLRAGIPLPELMALAKRHDQAVRESAEAAVELFDAHIRQPLKSSSLGPDERAQQLVEAFKELLPAVTSLVAHHFRRVVLEVAQAHLESVGEPAEIAAAALEAKKLTEQR